MADDRIARLIETAEAIKRGNFNIHLPIDGDDQITELAKKLVELASVVEKKYEEVRILSVITQKINTGIVLDDVLNYAFDNFNEFIPYDRIGFSLIEQNGKKVRSRWAKSRACEMVLGKGYSALLEKSSLKKIIETGNPRIINDLEQYLAEHPHSDSTQKILSEGIRSSLTCPLIVLGKPIGFMFFSSMQKNTYKDVHPDLFLQIAGQFSMIIEKSRLYDELLQKNEELKKLNELKSSFVSTVSHELRTPLTIIKEAVSQILDGILGPVAEKQQKSLAIAFRSCNRLMSIINDLLDMSKLEAKKVRLHKEYVNVVDLIHDVALSFEAQASQKGLQIRLECSKEAIKIEIDSGRITQVLTNLVGNSLKFTKEGSITIGINEDIDEVHCWVKDTGCGISEENLKKVFNRFEQFDRESGSGPRGTGLGLSICKQIIKLHGGEAWVESKLAQGTIVNFSLPKFSSQKYALSVVDEAFAKAVDQSLPLSLIAIRIDNKEAIVNSQDQEQMVAFLHRFESWIWQSLRLETDRVVRSGHTFYLTLFSDKKNAFSVAERISHVINEHLLKEETYKEPIRISWQLVSYPYDVISVRELALGIGLGKQDV